MQSKLILCLLIFLANGVFGVEAVEEVKKVEGESVTLHNTVQEYHHIIWLFGLQKKSIAQCRVNVTPRCEINYDRQTDRLKDRLKIDQSGSLTIINITNEDAGLYHLQIFSNYKKSEKEFSVMVYAPLPVPAVVKDSENSISQCVLLCSVVNVTEATLSWFRGNSSVSSVSVSDLNNSLSLRLKLNYQDTSIYSCVLNNSISSQKTPLNITELCQTRPGSGYIVMGVFLLVLGVIGAACFYRKKRQANQNGNTGANAGVIQWSREEQSL